MPILFTIRSAAKYSKGISVQYVVSQEDYLLIAMKVHRGQKAVDFSLNNICQLLHCRFCEERVFLSNQLAPHGKKRIKDTNPPSYKRVSISKGLLCLTLFSLLSKPINHCIDQ